MSSGYGKGLNDKSGSKKDLGKSNSELSIAKSQSIARLNAQESAEHTYKFNENESLIDKYIQSQNNNNNIQVPTHNSGFSRNTKKYS